MKTEEHSVMVVTPASLYQMIHKYQLIRNRLR